jgi:hypothetical protein
MSEVLDFHNGDFRFVKGVAPYSGAVAALSGFEIERARFTRPVALAEGFARIEAHLKGVDRPLTALCACELRSPAQCSEDGFRTFNQGYLGVLERWGLFFYAFTEVRDPNDKVFRLLSSRMCGCLQDEVLVYSAEQGFVIFWYSSW